VWTRVRSAGKRCRWGSSTNVAIDIVPVVFGRGKPYFGTLSNGHLMLEDPEVVSKARGAPFALSGASVTLMYL